ncbi:glycosyltransferase [Desulfoluna butyratoxydans]|uniref:Glycosyl transferase family 1 n=1 Tax=Desulfoluna butyratoxydans TaxID=231438 RepID=A0A4U8YS31_9BACT|nr:glycosyltransferase [Desulfoluna butyratoxydans]VFQ46554.1 glycosyl transferase family 1 [Desulfoluna butyratoxydans]
MDKVSSNRVAAIVQTGSGIVDPLSYNVQAIGQAKGMVKLGLSVDFYANFKNISRPTVIYKFKNRKLRVVPVKKVKIFREIVYFPGLIKRVTSMDYCFIQVGGDSQLMTPLILRAARRSGIMTVFIQGMYKNYKGYKYIFQLFFDRIFKQMIVANSDFVFAKTTMAKSYLLSKKYTDVNLFPIGLDIVRELDNQDLLRLTSEFKAKFDTLLLYIGKIEPRRNPKFLLQVLAALRDDGLSIGLLAVGQGPQYREFQNWIHEMSLDNCVLHIERVDNSEVHILYKHSDIFLLPTNYEIYGMVVMEALYRGCPVISTPEGGPLDILVSQEYGYCVDLKVSKWVQTIKTMLDVEQYDPQLRARRVDYIKNSFQWYELGKVFIERIGLIGFIKGNKIG